MRFSFFSDRSSRSGPTKLNPYVLGRQILSLASVGIMENLEGRRLLSGVEFPADAGVVRVTDFGVIPNDNIDDTLALQAVINANANKRKTIYFPDGVYNFSDSINLTGDGTLNPDAVKTVFQGQSRNATILKLNNNAAGFTNPAVAKAFVDFYNGNTANAFGNYVQDLTIDVGSGNAGAIGLEFQTSNYGAVRDVTIKSSDPAYLGFRGLNMAFNFPGPMLIKNVSIDGFSSAIGAAPQEYSITMENITLTNQQSVGITVWRTPLQIRNLNFTGAVTAVRSTTNPGAWGHVVLTDSVINGTGGASALPAIENESGAGVILVENTSTTGFSAAIRDSGVNNNGTAGNISLYGTDSARTLFAGTPATTLNLPVEETPVVDAGPIASWASITAFGAIANDAIDDSAAIQAAFNSGASTVYFPSGNYTLRKAVTVGGNVAKVIGLQSNIDIESGLWETGGAAFKVTSAAPVIEFVGFNSGEFGQAVFFDHATLSTLVFRDGTYQGYTNSVRGGKVFIENVTGGGHVFTGQKVWAWQLNPENESTKLINDGGDFWVLGLKTEKVGTVLESINRARSEVLGGLVYPVQTIPTDQPMFLSVDSQLTVSMPESSYVTNNWYNVWVRETRGVTTLELLRSALTRNHSNNGRMLTLFNGYPNDATAPVSPGVPALSSATTSSITLTWAAATDSLTGIQQYRIVRDGQFIATVAGSQTIYTDTGLNDATAYNYQIIAVNGSGLESPSVGTASLSTATDVAAPKLSAVQSSLSATTVVVTFDQPVSSASATNAANYSIDNGVTVSAAVLSSEGLNVTLTTSVLSAGVNYTLAATGVTDTATTPNAITPGSAKAFTHAANGTGAGLFLEIFDNQNFSGTRVTSTPATVDVNYGTAAPSAGFGIDTFSLRYTGKVQPRFSETYTFITRSDDLIRLYVNNQLIINNTANTGGIVERSGTIALQAGQLYDIQLEYAENNGSASVQLLWQSASQARQVISASQLYAPSSYQVLRTNIGTGADTFLRNNNIDDNGAGTSIPVTHDPATSAAHRAGYIRFDLSSIDRANFDVDAVQLNLSLLGGSTGSGIRELNVFGLNDNASGQNWVETGPGYVTWATAPGVSGGSASHGDPATSTFLGSVLINNAGFAVNGRQDGVRLQSAALRNFIMADNDGVVTLFIKRTTPSNEQTNFFTKENSAPFAPGLGISLRPKTTLTPSAVSLLAPSDTGVSNSDRLTNKNNASPVSALRVSVTGTTPGAVITLLSDGVVIGSAIATSTTTQILSDGGALLTDGPRNLTVRQQLAPRSVSGQTPALTVTIDSAAPSLTVPGDVSIEALSTSGTPVSYAPAGASDPSGIASISYSNPSGSSFFIGTTAVGVNATDNAGNVATASFDVTVSDPAFLSRDSIDAAYSFTGYGAGQTLTLSAGEISFIADASATRSDLSLSITGSDVTFASNQRLAGISITSGTLLTGTHSFVIDYLVTSPLSDLSDLIAGGQILPDGDFGGTATVLVLFEAADLGLTEFAGYSLSGPAVLAKYTYTGDANLDGQVDSFDYSVIDDNFGQPGTFITGDLNGDGVVDSFDYSSIDDTFGAGISSPLRPATLTGPFIPTFAPTPAAKSLFSSVAITELKPVAPSLLQ